MQAAALDGRVTALRPLDPSDTTQCDQCHQQGTHLCDPRADRVARFFSEMLKHTKGAHARRPFHLRAWQRRITDDVFGYVEWSTEYRRWVRQHRIAWLELPRKNGKSELLAGIALRLLVADGEEGAEIYGAARDRDQARKVFDVAARMVALSPELRQRLRVQNQAKRIVDEATGSYYEAVAADALGNLGHNPHGIIFDEVISQPNGQLWDAMRTGMGTRCQALMMAATTAGDDPNAFAAAEHDYSASCLAGTITDPRRYAVILNAPTEADPGDEQVWRDTNPALGEFLSIEAMRDEWREASQSPRKLHAFRQFRLNQWVSKADAWLGLDAWDSGHEGWQPLEGRRVVGGLDLASTTDLASLCLVAPRVDEDGAMHVDATWQHWLPEARLAAMNERTAGNAEVWVEAGLLELTEGNVIDHRRIRRAVLEATAEVDLLELAYDRWGMTHLMSDLQDHGITVTPFGQGYVSMSPPAKQVEELMLDGRLHHGGQPLLRWQVGHCVVRSDPAGNIKPDKERSPEKIDGIVAMVMAVGRLSVALTPPRRSVYEDHGLDVA